MLELLRVSGKGFHSGSVAALRGKLSWKLGAKSHCKTNFTQEFYWERSKRIASSALGRNSKELSRRQTYIGFHGGGVFQGEDCQGIGGVLVWVSLLRRHTMTRATIIRDSISLRLAHSFRDPVH